MKNIRLSALVLLATTAVSSSLFASTDVYFGDKDASFGNCDTNIEGELVFEDNTLTVTTKIQEKIRFEPAGYVSVDGENIELNREQQAQAKRYYASVERAIPMVVDVTVEALSITDMALTEVFTGFLGQDNALSTMIGDKLTHLSQKIEEHVYQDPSSLTFNSAYFEEDLGFDQGLDQEIEEIKEQAMSSFMGEVFVALGKAMMNGDTSMNDFETRMENLGSEIEIKAEAMAEALEEKANNLCATFEEIDSAESQLQQVAGLQHLNLIAVTTHKENKS